MNDLESLQTGLIALIERLRRAGWAIGVDQHLDAQRLLLNGRLPDDHLRLRLILAPVLCRSPREQVEFVDHFEPWAAAWLSPVAAEPMPVAGGTDPWTPPAPVQSAGPERARPRLARLRGQWRKALLGFLVLLLGWVLARRPEWVAEVWVFAALLVLVLALTLPGLRRSWDAFLTRRASARRHRPERFPVAGLTERDLDQTVGLARSAQRLRRHIEHGTGVLDLRATIERSIRAGNWFTPVYRRGRRTPEYLVLIDRASLHDHQARLALDLVWYLNQHELVAVDRYFFDRDPRYCFTERHPSHGLTLAELRERYGRHRLILFADGSGFFDAYTGQPREWLEQLRHWGTPALFALAVPGHWRNPEQRLLALGLRLFSADPAGIAAFADSWEVTAPRALGAAGAAARLPTMLSDLPRRWLSPEAPDLDTQAALIDDLRGYLGEDGLLWLAACAVYPELHWPLTLELGRRLELPGFVALLARLSALPWFRHGRMPDWLREALLDALGEREQELRGKVEALLGQPTETGVPLELVVPGETEDPAKPAAELQQYVFLGSRGGRLSVRAVRLRRRLLRAWRQVARRAFEPLRDELSRLRRRWVEPLGAVLQKARRSLPDSLRVAGRFGRTEKQNRVARGLRLAEVSFAGEKWLVPLYKKLRSLTGARAAELARIGDTFGDPKLLVRYYVQPFCQHSNPADRYEDYAPMAQVRQPAFEVINAFLKGDYPPLGDGRTQLFILADAGMGKTSLLVMIRLMHLTAFWPQGYDCRLLKLGPDTLEQVRGLPNQTRTVVLLDALDEDPTAWPRIEGRLIEILSATRNFRRVILSCRTQFFPEAAADAFGRPGRVQVGGYTCPMVFLSLFDDDQLDAYLRRRFPDTLWQRFMARDNPVRERAWGVVRSMESLRFRPLLLAHIQDIMEAGERQWDSYSLYEALVDRWLAREEVKLRRQMERAPDKETLWRVCVAVARRMHEEGTRLLERDQLDALVARFPAVAALQHFNIGGRSLMNRNADGAYRFSHYSIQDFLVVHALVGNEARSASGAGRPRVRVNREMLGFLHCVGLGPLLGQLDLSGLTAESLVGIEFRDRIADGSEGPPMKLVPAGVFWMGSAHSERSASSDEQPRHDVRIGSAFALGRYPVTFDEYDRFCVATRREKPHDQGWGRGDRPVIDVGWDDAVAYCDWLSRETGQRYRLPSEAEWEYACRAGTETLWSFGDDASQLSEYAWFAANSRKQTWPVAQKLPNPWGFHDLHGNVREWVLDCWRENYKGVPLDKEAPDAKAGDCARRVVRGGAWGDQPEVLRSASRGRLDGGSRYPYVGFRVVRTLVP